MKKIWIGMILLLVFAISCSKGGSSPTGTTKLDTTTTTKTDTTKTDTTKTNTTKTTLSNMNPANGATNISVKTTVTGTFSGAMISSTVITSNNIKLLKNSQNVSAVISYDSTNYSFTLTPGTGGQLEYKTTYTVVVTVDVKNLAGNPLDKEYTWSFTTENEPTYNIVKSVTPDAGSNYISNITKHVDVVFTEEIDIKTIDTTTFFMSINGNKISGHITVDSSYYKGASFYPDPTGWYYPSSSILYNSTYFVPGNTYKATLTSGIKTLWTNHTASEYSWTFKTWPDLDGPWAPSNSNHVYLTVSGIDIYLSWWQFQDDYWITKYKIYRNGNLLTTIDVPQAPPFGGVYGNPYPYYYTDTNLNHGTVYGYAISAVDIGGNESLKTPISFGTTSVN